MRHGFLLVNKPTGPTSHDVVAQVRRALSEKKIGHLGTLDPAAEGLLVLAVGAKALKVVELFGDLTKGYRATVIFGAVSTTYDREGVMEEVALKPGVAIPDQVHIQNVIADRFIGKISQVPPGYSAVKVGGERAYRKMRQGRTVDIPARTVEISKCRIVSYEYPTLVLDVQCSSGTYIRSLAHDLGTLLKCGGYLGALQRTRVGEWNVEDSVPPADAKWTNVIPLKEVMKSFQGIELTDEELDHITHGRLIEREVQPSTIAWHADLPVAILIPARDGSRKAHARKVL